jgi:hypothetical protein
VQIPLNLLLDVTSLRYKLFSFDRGEPWQWKVEVELEQFQLQNLSFLALYHPVEKPKVGREFPFLGEIALGEVRDVAI